MISLCRNIIIKKNYGYFNWFVFEGITNEIEFFIIDF